MNSPVDFMIIGVQKCGTTSLAHIISQHPEIDFCYHKEPDFFSITPDWRKNLDSYHALYSKEKSYKIKGEASTTYSWLYEYPGTAQRLFDYNPNLKLIYMVRDPLERMVSHYMHEFARGRAGKNFRTEILQSPKYLQHSMYYAQLLPFLRLFPRQNFHFVLFDDFVNDQAKTLGKVFDFLQVKNISISEMDTEAQNQTLKRKGEHKVKKYLAPYVRFIPLNIRNMFRAFFEFPIDKKTSLDEQQKIQLQDMLTAEMEQFASLSGIKFNSFNA